MLVGFPTLTSFSYVAAALIASSGSATSMSFLGALMVAMCCFPLCRLLRTGEQLIEIEVDAGHRPIGLLGEGLPHIERPVMLFTVHHHDGQDELVGLVEPVEDLVARDGDRGLALGAALDLDVARGWQLAVQCLGQAGDVPTALL